MPKLPRTIIGIAAYNSESNILYLIRSILRQEKYNYNLAKIVIFSDGSTDKTVSLVKSIKDPRIKIISVKKNQGFANSLKRMVLLKNYEIICILNDDILIRDNKLFSKIIKSFNSNPNVGMVCGNNQPIKATNFVENAVKSGFLAYKNLGNAINNGNTGLTCDGKLLAFTKKFIESVKFPINNYQMGNVDSFMFCTCIRNGFNYLYARDAIYYFRCPSTRTDFIKWQIRNFANFHLIKKQFSNVVKEHYASPIYLSIYFRGLEFVKNPIGSIYILLLGLYCKILSQFKLNKFNANWDTVKSTKSLINETV